MKKYEVYLELTNEMLKRYRAEVEVIEDEDEIDSFTVKVKYTDCERWEIFSTCIPQNELTEVIFHASESARIHYRQLNEEYVILKKVHGWTHDDPALIETLTEVPVYFLHKEGGLSVVGDDEAGIDGYTNSDGIFLVLEEDYEKAYRQVYDHDEHGAEF